MKKLIGFLTAGLIFSSGAKAQFMTGNTLLEACDSQHQADRNVSQLGVSEKHITI